MKLLHVLYIILMSMVISGCFYTKMTHLSDDDLKWTGMYHAGDAFLFSSNFGNTDTLVVSSTQIANSRNPFFFNEGNSSHFDACSNIRFEILEKLDTITGYMCLRKQTKNDSLSVVLRLGHRTTIEDPDLYYYATRLRPQIRRIGSSEFDDCVVVDSTNSELVQNRYDIRSLQVTEYVWSKQYGLIYYRFSDGEKFTLKSRITLDREYHPKQPL